jgi:hypothetical protein
MYVHYTGQPCLLIISFLNQERKRKYSLYEECSRWDSRPENVRFAGNPFPAAAASSHQTSVNVLIALAAGSCVDGPGRRDRRLHLFPWLPSLGPYPFVQSFCTSVTLCFSRSTSVLLGTFFRKKAHCHYFHEHISNAADTGHYFQSSVCPTFSLLLFLLETRLVVGFHSFVTKFYFILKNVRYLHYLSYKRRFLYTRWFKYDRDDLCVNKSQFFPVIFELPCIIRLTEQGL